MPLSSPLIARLKAFSATIPTAPNSGYAKLRMEIQNCTNAPRVTFSTTKQDDVWKKIKWNATKRWIWLCYGQNPLMSINSKSHNWHLFSTDMQLCNFNKCNKITVIGRPTGKKGSTDSSSTFLSAYTICHGAMPTMDIRFLQVLHQQQCFCIRFEIRSVRSISWLYEGDKKA